MVIALSLKEQKSDVVNQSIRELQNGRNNATGSFTLTPSATTTTVLAVNCSPSSFVFLSPQTQDAANDMATTSIVAGKGQFVVTHANNARVDRTFGYVVLGGN
jgi:hypothetical protein